MKNFLKKVSLLSSAALLALGLGMPLASAAAPTAETAGTMWNNPVSIARGEYVYNLTLELASGLRYNGQPKQLITGVTTGTPEHGTLYLRVGGETPSSAQDWVAYTSNDDLASDALKKTNVGTYHVYYYMDDNDADYESTINPVYPQQP